MIVKVLVIRCRKSRIRWSIYECTQADFEHPKDEYEVAMAGCEEGAVELLSLWSDITKARLNIGLYPHDEVYIMNDNGKTVDKVTCVQLAKTD